MKIDNTIEMIETLPMTRALRTALVMSIPILMIGSFSLILKSLPIPAYQRFFEIFFGGALRDILDIAHRATFGIFSLYMVLAVSRNYSQDNSSDPLMFYGAPIASLISFVILCGFFSGRPSIAALGVNGMFTALLCAVCIPPAYLCFVKRFGGRRRIYTKGADYIFNLAIGSLLPLFLTVLFVSSLNYIIVQSFGVSGLYELLVKGGQHIFSGRERSLKSAVLFLVSSGVMWFFGIHGNNVLDSVIKTVFYPGIEVNHSMLAVGLVPSEILTKTFFDTFVYMGGCGGAISLLAAVLIFSKRPSSRNLAKLAFLPMLFNVNEIMLIGLPVVLNPIFLIPFILTPITSCLISYAAFYFELLPVTVNAVEWTTPVLYGGYASTGSMAGVLLQLVNMIVGVFIYRPFILFSDKEQELISNKQMNALVRLLQEQEVKRSPVMLTELYGTMGAVAKELAEDLDYALFSHELMLYYQPQFDDKRRCIGAEALLRWNHRRFGFIYPPLIIKLAEEKGFLSELEENIIIRAAKDLPLVQNALGSEISVSVNVSGLTIETDAFEQFLKKAALSGKINAGKINLEVTEQMALSSDPRTEERLRRICALGFHLEIDDFSMGHTSVKFLQSGIFGTVKLDGAIIKDILHNQRSREIIASIMGLSRSLGFKVIAEYVENEAIMEALEEIGCRAYQGYLFSPPLPLDRLPEAVKK